MPKRQASIRGGERLPSRSNTTSIIRPLLYPILQNEDSFIKRPKSPPRSPAQVKSERGPRAARGRSNEHRVQTSEWGGTEALYRGCERICIGTIVKGWGNIVPRPSNTTKKRQSTKIRRVIKMPTAAREISRNGEARTVVAARSPDSPSWIVSLNPRRFSICREDTMQITFN